jgi:hypothetical protein
MSASIAIERQGPVGLITMNRPERHNAFDDAVIAELIEALRSFEAEDGIRLVVLSAAGKSFSAGADLNWMKRMAGFSKEENLRDAMGLGALMRTLAHLRVTIARAGAAYGGGVGRSPAATSRSPRSTRNSRFPRRSCSFPPSSCHDRRDRRARRAPPFPHRGDGRSAEHGASAHPRHGR